MSIDIGNLSAEELMKLELQIKEVIKEKKAESIRLAKLQIREIAAKAGLDVVINETKEEKPAVRRVKYRNPNNATETWSGRGKPPRWFRDAVDAGEDINKLKV